MSQNTPTKTSAKTPAEKSMGLGLRWLNNLASSSTIDKLKLRKSTEKALFHGSKNGFKVAAAAGRQFSAKSKQDKPARQPKADGVGKFDLTPDDEQEMLIEAFGDFAQSELLPIATKSSNDCITPPEVLKASTELGVTMIGVPEELGGAVEQRSAVTSVLISEVLAKGDLGMAVAVLAPAAVSTAIGLWGDADQQSTYLPEFVGEDVPAAALAVMEPTPMFDPFKLQTRATKDADGGYTLNGVKSLVPRAGEAELFVIAAELDGAPRMFIVESRYEGISVTPEPAMGIRPAATGTLSFEGTKLPKGALLGEPADYTEMIRLSRIAWGAVTAGCGRAVQDYLIPYVNERKAFGEPIAYRQAVAFTISNVAIELEGIRLATYRAAALADAGKDFARESALVRQLTQKYGMQIGSDGVQMLGGHGYTQEYPVERWYRDLRAAGLMEGVLLV
ncbi:MAG: acyl-CoA dehydrogenase family protein [Thermoleophilaceae bacterium]|nr:acyl-CoA dehydrogenase family protein [Thermoleophilaceae bacterium]